MFWCLPGLALAQTPADALTEKIDRIDEQYYFTQPDSALLRYHQLAIAARPYPNVALDAYLRMAWCALHHSRLDTFQSSLRQAELIAQQHPTALDTLDPHRALRVNIPYTWGLFYEQMGDHWAAIEALRPIVAHPEQYQDSSLISHTYYQLGLCYHSLENYHQAIVYRQLALQWLSRKAPDQQFSYYQALFNLALGTSYDQLASVSRQTHQSRSFYTTSLNILLDYGSPERVRDAVLTNYRLLARWYLTHQQYDSALWQLEQSLPWHTPDPIAKAPYFLLKADIYTAQQRYREARKLYFQALATVENTYHGKYAEKGSIEHSIGENYLADQQIDSALSHFQKSLIQLVDDFDDPAVDSDPTLAQIRPTKEILQALSSKAEALLSRNKSNAQDTSSLRQAITTYHLTVGVLDQIRQTFPSLEYKQYLSAKAATLYERAIQAALRAHELGFTQKDFLAEAFYFMEKGKAATLLEAVKTSQARSFANIPTSLLEQENSLKRKLTYWENELYQASEDSVRRTLRNHAFETREAYNTLISQLEKEYPNYYQLKYDTKVLTLEQLQGSLPQGTTLLSFSYGDSTLYSFAIRSDKVQWQTTPLDSSFRQSLENVLQTISQYDYARASDLSVFRKFTNDAHGLYQTLLAPWLSAETKTERLIIIADGLLGYLPFDVLLTEAPDATRVDYQSLPYLVKQLPVSYEYSATLLSSTPKALQDTPYSYLGFAPSYPEAPLAESREVRTTLDGQRLGLSQLRYNREEVAFAAELFKGQTFVNETATEAHFKQYAPQSAVLHLSMHAYANDENDDFSGLIFTQQSDTVHEDGFLHSNELYDLSLPAELAVLSACETGIGTLAPGEGIMSLGRAFKYAGCPNVTMSLWNADDQSTSLIMQRFFAHLHQGAAKDQALRKAKLDYLNEARSAQAHPYYWAAFVQVGDSNPLSSVVGVPVWWWVVGGSVALLIFIGVVRYYKS